MLVFYIYRLFIKYIYTPYKALFQLLLQQLAFSHLLKVLRSRYRARAYYTFMFTEYGLLKQNYGWLLMDQDNKDQIFVKFNVFFVIFFLKYYSLRLKLKHYFLAYLKNIREKVANLTDEHSIARVRGSFH